MITHSADKAKLAIIGVGAVTEERYLPATALTRNLIVTHLVDLDVKRGREIAHRFQIPNFVRDYRDVFGQVDAVVVATPPKSHAPISIDCLNQGLPVLCEKPLATTTQEAEAMIAASQHTQTILAVGMIRRLGFGLLKHLFEADFLGDIHRFDIEEGGEFGWPLRTGHIFQDRTSGGVLNDTGPHLIDLSLWLLGSRRVQLQDYQDDSWGGVEANAVVALIVERNSGSIPGRIELSFTRKLRNTLKIYGERGCLEVPTRNSSEIWFYPGNENSEPLIITSSKEKPRTTVENFAIQLSNFADSITNGSRQYVAAEDVVTTISLIEQCRHAQRSIAYPWEVKHLESFFEVEDHGR